MGRVFILRDQRGQIVTTGQIFARQTATVILFRQLFEQHQHAIEPTARAVLHAVDAYVGVAGMTHQAETAHNGRFITGTGCHKPVNGITGLNQAFIILSVTIGNTRPRQCFSGTELLELRQARHRFTAQNILTDGLCQTGLLPVDNPASV